MRTLKSKGKPYKLDLKISDLVKSSETLSTVPAAFFMSSSQNSRTKIEAQNRVDQPSWLPHFLIKTGSKRPVAPFLIRKNRVKEGQISSKSAKPNQRKSYKKNPGNGVFPGFLSIFDCKNPAD
ncbi:MAG: hypothetical protein LUG93_00600 [Lachnospiraceae bacterium]|nr:hypothetical protein [Lachnospiraceae bacterium]